MVGVRPHDRPYLSVELGVPGFQSIGASAVHPEKMLPYLAAQFGGDATLPTKLGDFVRHERAAFVGGNQLVQFIESFVGPHPRWTERRLAVEKVSTRHGYYRRKLIMEASHRVPKREKKGDGSKQSTADPQSDPRYPRYKNLKRPDLALIPKPDTIPAHNPGLLHPDPMFFNLGSDCTHSEISIVEHRIIFVTIPPTQAALGFRWAPYRR